MPNNSPNSSRMREQLADQQRQLEDCDDRRKEALQAAAAAESANQDLTARMATLQARLDLMSQPQTSQGAPSTSAASGFQFGSSQPPTNPLFPTAPPPPAPQAGIGTIIHTLNVDLSVVPSFSGESRDVTVEQFLKAFKSYVEINNIPPAIFKAVLNSKTEGLANDLVQRLKPLQLVQLADIERAFRQEFRPGQYIIALDQRVANTRQLPGELASDFFSRASKAVRELKNASTRHVGITDEAWAATWEARTFSAFIGGLRQEIYTFVLSRNPTSLREAQNAAMAAEETEARGRLFQVGYARAHSFDEEAFAHVRLAENKSIKEAATAMWRHDESAETEKSSRGRPATPFCSRVGGSSSAPHSRNNSPGTPSRSRSPRYNSCNICRLEGHWARECPYKACGACGAPGHLPFECPQLHPKN